ncbi:CheY-like chemotaxis protein [Sagittula marina]|uniref:CheY-like chemotaxis protein n=1 Tax=Sagittula marina TaxID=943940 RepID=A0A7W6GUW1_9RHOB|nr:response regulator [Sagittula marina]MBB3988232.1 CheY-like chemotaxis protein [Sagittula marina]
MIKHLMTIDDEPIDQKMYRRLISKSGIVETLHQPMSGQEALNFLAAPDCPKIDAMLLDINMPGMSGFDFLEKAQAAHGNSFVRYAVLMLSSSTRRQDQERAAAFPMVQDYLAKPLTIEALEAIDKKLAEINASPAQSIS